MRLFGYYALHTFKNQLRKLLKSWVLILIICCGLIGGLVGFGAGLLSEKAEEQQAAEMAEEVTEDQTEPPFEGEIDIGQSQTFVQMAEEKGISGNQLIELFAGGILLLLFVLQIIGADKNGSKIFLPADVNLLFSSPMQPQSVLMFRMMTQIGLSIFMGIYLLFQLPNLVLNFGLTVPQGVAIIVAFAMATLCGTLIKVLIYTLSSTHPGFKKYWTYGLWALLAILLLLYAQSYLRKGGVLESAVRVFDHPALRWVPFIGWIKGFVMSAVEGNLPMVLVFLGLLIAGSALLVYVIWRIKADFYEDAMAKSQEVAEALEAAQASRTGIAFTKRKKDRSDSLRRDGFDRGEGANVFFYKTMYNRFRFARFGIFTKTASTYLIASVLISLFCKFVLETDGFTALMIILGIMVFYRSLGNSYDSDIKMSHFILIPDKTRTKLFYSLLGNNVNTLLDLLPAVIVAVIILNHDPLQALAWVIFVVTIDYFATVTGAFIGLSTPQNAGATVKQVVQIMFLYFGLLPDAAIIAVGLVFKKAIPALAGASVLNILLGSFFLILCPFLIDPPERAARFRGVQGIDLQAAKKTFSMVGFGLVVLLGVSSGLQFLLASNLEGIWPGWQESGYGVFFLSMVPLYLVAFPLAALIWKRIPAHREARPFPKVYMIPAFLISVFMLYAGNIAGTLIVSLLQRFTGVSGGNVIAQALDGTGYLPRILFMVILAPIMEEFVFRRILIDRLRPYGEKTAVLCSALCFGLFHGNLQQFTYAFLLGLVLGYVYLRMGKLRYSAALHIVINLMGGVIAPWLLEGTVNGSGEVDLMNPASVDPEMIAKLINPRMIGLVLYIILMIGCFIAGLILLVVLRNRITFVQAEKELPAGTRTKTAVWNPGMVLFILGSIAMIIFTLISV